MERYLVFVLAIAGSVAALVLGLTLSPWFWLLFLLLAGLTALGIYDLLQVRHSLLRNYPILAHMRWLFEGIRPEIRQYLFEADEDAVPFNREQRALVYQRAKNELQTLPFGTQKNVYEPGYVWLTHSLAPKHIENSDFRVTIGGADCAQHYNASVFNVSAMSFGSLSANAILSLNTGAKLGGFAHDTGEGGISRHHREGGGDIIWEIGSGYFGCRADDGGFDADKFAKQAADPQIMMIEVKLSQGAKPGHGGVLPAAKITPGNRRGPRRADGRVLHLAGQPFRLLDTGGVRPFPRQAARAFRRQAGRLQALPRASLGIHGDAQGDDRDRHLPGLHCRRRQGRRHGRGPAGILQFNRHAAARGADLRA